MIIRVDMYANMNRKKYTVYLHYKQQMIVTDDSVYTCKEHKQMSLFI